MQDHLASLLEDFQELKYNSSLMIDQKPMSDTAAALLVFADQFWMISEVMQNGIDALLKLNGDGDTK